MTILNASDPVTAKQLNDIIKKAKHVFILVYMVGCGPCNATRPEWKKMCNSQEDNYLNNDDVAILDLDSKFMNNVDGLGDIQGFPTMKYLSDNGKIIEDYNGDRKSEDFIEWIEDKLSKSKNLIWMGAAKADIYGTLTPDRREQIINQAVQKILENFPPPPSK